MSQLSMSADETGSAVVVSGYRGSCLRFVVFVIDCGYRGAWRCHLVLGASFKVPSNELGLRDLRRLRLRNMFARKAVEGDYKCIAAIRDGATAAILAEQWLAVSD